MSENGVWFDCSSSQEVNSSGYHKGERVGGCHVDMIGRVDADIRSVYDVNKASRSLEINIPELEVGHIVDLSYKRSSNSVNTPYRVEEICMGDGEYNDTFEEMEVDFKILFEPIVQNASLVLLCGSVRNYEDSPMSILKEVYYKRKWDTPEVEGLDDMEYPSEFFDVGFEEKERRMTAVSLLFDEVIAECVGLESELMPVVI